MFFAKSRRLQDKALNVYIKILTMMTTMVMIPRQITSQRLLPALDFTKKLMNASSKSKSFEENEQGYGVLTTIRIQCV